MSAVGRKNKCKQLKIITSVDEQQLENDNSSPRRERCETTPQKHGGTNTLFQ
jgi:hypothetical protein